MALLWCKFRMTVLSLLLMVLCWLLSEWRSCQSRTVMIVFYLPHISAEFLVVETLDAISADWLLGLDIISATGGVRLEYGEEPGVLMSVVFVA